MAVFLLGPIIWSLYGSMTNTALTGPRAADPQFVGLDNYTKLLASSEFWTSVLLTVVFVTASAVVGQNVLGMALAVLTREAHRRSEERRVGKECRSLWETRKMKWK